MNKKRITIIIFIIMACALFILSGCDLNKKTSNTIQRNYSTLSEYNDSIDYSCTIDTDCQIKDVHNCCGIYPKCVNKEAKVDPEFVRLKCEEEGLASICGYPAINACNCKNNLCEGYLKN